MSHLSQLFTVLGKKLRDTGFFSIVVAGTLNKVIAFISGVILVRVVSKSDYGAYSYALNIINYFVLLNGLGTSSCVVQLCVEKGGDSEAAERVYSAACSLGMLWDLVLTALIVVFALAVPLPLEGANRLLLLLAPFPLFSLAVSFQQERLRSRLMNSQYAVATNVNSVAVLGLSVAGALAGSATGLSVGRSAGMALSALLTNRLYKVRIYLRPEGYNRALVADILKMAVTVCLTNAVSQALTLVGTTLVGNLTGDQELVASYSTATTIPFALAFLPGMVITYASPYFIKRNRERAWMLRHWGLLALACGGISVCVAGVCFACADWLVPLVFGEQYASSVEPFRVLLVAFAINSAFAQPAGNVLAFHRRYIFNLCSTAARLAVALGASWALVPAMGIEGAAWGYLAAICVGSVINVIGCAIFAGYPKDAPELEK